jgi:hypothetical protein
MKKKAIVFFLLFAGIAYSQHTPTYRIDVRANKLGDTIYVIQHLGAGTCLFNKVVERTWIDLGYLGDWNKNKESRFSKKFHKFIFRNLDSAYVEYRALWIKDSLDFVEEGKEEIGSEFYPIKQIQ